MASAADTQRALARPSSKMKNCLFRLFRWTPEFEVGKDSSMAAVWVKFYNLRLQFYNESSLIRIGSAVGSVLAICPNTINLTQQVYARMCIELDVSKPLLESLFMGTSKEEHLIVELEYEGNNAYCTHCGLLGHVTGMCRKKYPHLVLTKTTGNNQATLKAEKQKEVRTVYKEKQPLKVPISILKRGEINDKTQAVLKEVGLVSSDESAKTTEPKIAEDTQSGANPPAVRTQIESTHRDLGLVGSPSQSTEERVDDNSCLEPPKAGHDTNEPMEKAKTMDTQPNETQGHPEKEADTTLQAHKIVAFAMDNQTCAVVRQETNVSNKFQPLSSCEDVGGLETRSDGNYVEEDGDGATSKSDGEINKSKKGKHSKRSIPPSDRFTRSVAKKGSSTTS